MERVFGAVPRYLEGDEVFVVGGGPSLVNFDLSHLPGRRMIGANDAGRLSHAGTIVTLDRNYYRHRHADLVEAVRAGRMVFCALPNDMSGVLFPEEIVQLKFARGAGLGLSARPEELFGLNSGFAALNVAFLAGAKKINLLGFDFRFSSQQSHWHPDHFWHRQSSDRQLRRWAKDFSRTTAQLRSAGVEIVNYVGPGGSEIDAYDTAPLDTLRMAA